MTPTFARQVSRIMMVVIMMIALQACPGPSEKPIVKEKLNPSVAAVAPSDCTMNAALPILWIETSQLLAANGPIVFRFYVDDWCDLTLHGWRPPFNNSTASIKLKTSILSNIDVTQDNYLGNLYLGQAMLNEIRRQVDANHWVYIKFHPVIDQRNGSVGQVTYRYELTNTVLRLKSTIPQDSLKYYMDSTMYSLTDSSLLTSDYLNPSPPRNEQ